ASASAALPPPDAAPPSSRSLARVAYRWSRAARRRNPSIARRRPTVSSQPAGLSGTPSRGQLTSASARASWARSSASTKSPVYRASAPTMRADSIRQTAATVSRSAVVTTFCGGTVGVPRGGSELPGRLAPRPLLLDPRVVLRELVDRGDAADLGLEARPAGRDPLGPLHRLLLGGDVEQEESAEQLLGLAVRAVGDHRRLGGVVDHHPLLGVVQALRGQQYPGPDQLVVEPAHRLDHLVEVELAHPRVTLVGGPHDQHVLHHHSLSGNGFRSNPLILRSNGPADDR